MFLVGAWFLLFANTSCGQTAHEVEDWKKYQKKDTTEIVEPVSGDAIPSDMVLLYGGGRHRSPISWTADILKDYVCYTDENNKSYWLFDGFLMLEFKDTGTSGSGKTYVTGYYADDGSTALPSATRTEWEYLANYYFEDGAGVNALEAAISVAAAELGSGPDTKRKVMIGVPEPIATANWKNSSASSTYWGQLGGRTLDFSKTADRLAACKWYMDKVIANFNSHDYRYVELAGFYWVAEKATQSRDLMSKIATYLDGKNLTFNWIPYFNADGYSEWKSYGFDVAYLQPNYFFSTTVPDSRLDDACSKALQYGMGMEIEFDGNALASNGRGYRLTNYMNAFKKYGVWKSLPIAYYQGSWALRWLKASKNAADNELYHDFCKFVVSRPYRDSKSE